MYCIDHKTKKLYYADYGKISIARNLNEIYVKKGSSEQKETTRQNETVYGKIFSMTLTNGKDIMYQSGKDVYLWKNVEKKVKLLTFAKYSYILTAVYGDEIYFQKDMSKEANGQKKYSLYKYNLKTKKTTNMNIDNVYYSNGDYMVCAGKYKANKKELPIETEGFLTLSVYYIEEDWTTVISEKAGGGWAALIDGDELYYTTAKAVVPISMIEYRANVVRCNLRSSDQKKTIKKNVKGTLQCFIDKNRFVCDDSENDYLYDIQENSKSVI